MRKIQRFYIEIEVEVELVSKGSPPTGPTYDSGGEPGYGPEFEVVSYKIGEAVCNDETYNKWKSTHLSLRQTFSDFVLGVLEPAIKTNAAESWNDRA